MRNKAIVVAISTALLTSGAAFAQVKGPGTGTSAGGPSNGDALSGTNLQGVVCSEASGVNCSAAIPDNLTGTVESTMTLENCGGPITDINVGVSATHSWVGDLIFQLEAPDTTVVTLIDRPGVPASTFGCDGADIAALLDDGAGAPVENECAGGVPTINGSFQPNGSLSDYNGVDPNGTWTLIVTDNAGGDTGSLDDWSLDITPAGCEGAAPDVEADPQASFLVMKANTDNNPEPVDVTLSCNTGLPLEQTYSLTPDRTGNTYVNFIVNDFADGEMDCTVTETIPAGYTPDYLYWNDSVQDASLESCVFENVAHGELAVSQEEEINHVCFIGNVLNFSDVTVNKEWIDENPQFNGSTYAEASYFCSNLPEDDFTFNLPILGGAVAWNNPDALRGLIDFGNLEFFGNPGVDGFLTLGNWDGGTVCTITENVVESGIESDASDCDSLVIGPGEDVECTIVNTRLYEGIPTLSQYGLGLLALMMLGMGFVAVRRFV